MRQPRLNSWLPFCLFWPLAICSLASPSRALERSSTIPLATAGLASTESTAETLALPDGIAVDYSSLELRLFDDAADGQLDAQTLLEAGLIASGVSTTEELDRAADKLRCFVNVWRVATSTDQPLVCRAETLLERMHGELLNGGYEHDATRIDELLASGRFNCVSATLVWQCLAESCGLQSIAIESPGHVHAELIAEGNRLPVETTCPGWFSLLGDPQKQHAVRQAVGASGSSPTTLGESRELNELGLVAAIYYNRAIDLLEQQRFAEAVAGNAKACRLDPGSEIARGNLLASINNWSLHLAAEGDFARSIGLLSAGRRLAPAHQTFAVNYVAIHQQWIERLSDDGRHADALTLARRLSKELTEQAFFRQVQPLIEARLQTDP